MSYNTSQLPHYINSAGKITIVTAVSALVIFAVVFFFNVGQTEIKQLQAQSNATTSVTVLNTPPEWVPGQEGREEVESSVSNPTNSGNEISWIGTAVDANGQDYYMIVCSASSTPNPNPSAPPNCTAGVQWGVSQIASSGAQVRVSTTTTEASPFAESNDWYAYVCDATATDARCFNVNSTGTAATNSAPFNVNSRPTFTGVTNDSPTDPGATVTFTSVSDDPDVVATDDTVRLHVCYQNDYATSSNSCGPGGAIASTTIPGPTANATAAATLDSIIQDATYDAYVYVHDNHGHEAIGQFQGTSSPFTVNNVAPTGVAGTASINAGGDLVLTEAGGETTGFSLQFETSDANSCDAVGGGNADEMVDFQVSLYRSGVGSSSCLTGVGQDFNQNNCYNTAVATSTWNIACTASSTSCSHSSSTPDDTLEWNCTFPLWYIADATDPGSFYFDEDWRIAVGAVDDDGASTTNRQEGSNPVDLLAFTAFDLLDQLIAYGSLEPGDDTGTLAASTTVVNQGNTGINQNLSGTSMCESAQFLGAGCDEQSSTSTIPVEEQEFADLLGTSYGAGTDLGTSSQLLALQVTKPTATSTPTNDDIFWGIRVPGTISLAGDYTGQNTYVVVASASSTW